MKNVVPVIIVVALGFVAVFSVSRLLHRNDKQDAPQTVSIVAAAKDILPNDGPVKENWLMKREVEAISCPMKAIPWGEVQRVIGQTVARPVLRGDYVLSADVQAVDIHLDTAVAEGEWAVPITFSDQTLTRFLQPGMEISILATHLLREEVRGKDATQKPEIVERRATSVLFPCVKILDVGKGDATRRISEFGENPGSSVIVVSVTPQQAATIIAAQRTMELYPALRRTADPSARMRRDVGIVNDDTFKALQENMETVRLPAGAVEKK